MSEGDGKQGSEAPDEAAHAFGEAVSFHRRGRLEEARRAYLRALSTQPDFPDALTNYGSLLRSLGRHQAAIALHRRALALRPESAPALCNLGNALRDLGRLEEAFDCLRQAFALDPESANNAFNLGLALRDLGHLDEAVACFDKVIAREPGHVSAHWDRAFTLLMAGRLKEGFEGYEWRWRLPGVSRPALPGAEWDGAARPGTTLLLYPEQGFGDSIQFARYAPLLARRGMRVALMCQPPLVRLFGAIEGVARVVSTEEPPPEADAHAALMSLPRLLGTAPAGIPAEVPYLAPPGPRKLVLPGPPGALKVGIVWAGKPTHRNDRNRSATLADLLPLIEVPGTVFFSLQKGPRAAELAAAGLDDLVRDLDPHLADFADTADAIAQLDVVVCVDTAVAHLAGALAQPALVLVPAVGDWRWMLRREDSPWYPTLRLLRQKEPRDWSAPVARAAKALAEMAAARRAAAAS
ncbi:MAG: glycosyltransferase family protein [Proteobacteria bacterium]|nr:glycosyltransferase family protein [Pseudomonadota bacterium]